MHPLAASISTTPDGPPTALQREMASRILDAFEAAGFTVEAGMAAVVNAWAESKLNPKAWGDRSVHPEGCSGGLFQLNRCAGLGRGLSRDQVVDPKTNIDTILRTARRSRAFSAASPTDPVALSMAMTTDILRPSHREEKARARAALLPVFWPFWSGTLGEKEERPGGGGGRAVVDRPATGTVQPWYAAAWSEGRVDRDWDQGKKWASLDPSFRSALQRVFRRLEAEGYRPMIWFGWRRPGMQADLLKKGRSAVTFSFHEALGDRGQPAALAADIIDPRFGWGTKIVSGKEVADPKTFPLAKRFFSRLGSLAESEGLWWGGRFAVRPGTLWGDARMGWDPGHVQGRSGEDLPAVARATEAIWAEGLARQGFEDAVALR
jgi:hypothetical protein